MEVPKSFCKYDVLSYYTSDYMSYILCPSVLRHAARRETESFPLVCGGQVNAQPCLHLVQPHLPQRTVHKYLVHKMPRFNIVKFTEILLSYDIFPLEEVINAIDVTRLERVNEELECDLVLHYLADHELYAAALFDLPFDMSIIDFKGTFRFGDFFFDPSCKVNSIDESLRVIVVFL